MKRFLSVILTAVLLVNLFCMVPAVADAAEDFTLSTVYVDNSLAQWDQVFIFGWDNGIDGEMAMTRIDGTDFWYYELPQPLAAGTEFLFKNTASGWYQQSPNVVITEPFNCYKLSPENKGQGDWTIYSTGYTVYYVDSAYFEQPYAYAWNEGGESCGDMPGIAMTKTALVSPEGSPVYSCTFDTAYESIIFGDGADIWTQDLEFQAGQFLYWSDDTWYPLLSDIPVPSCTVYFQNNWLWSDVKLYYWYEDDSYAYAWPGDSMELYGNDGSYDIYSYTVPGDAVGFVINGIKNDGSGSLDKTPNIESWYDGVCYSMIWNDGNDVLEDDISVILPEEDTAELVGYSLSLTGKIGVNFHFDISGGLACNGDTKVIFTVPSGEGTYTEEVEIGFAEQDGNGNYVFTCYVAAKEMTSVIKAQIVSTEFTGEEEEYTVQAYADYILAHPEDFPEEQALVKAMLNYGTAAQLHFGHNTDQLANDSDNMSDADRTVGTQDLSAYAPVIEGEEGEVKFCGGSLVLKSETALKLYFRVNADMPNPAVGVNGMTAGLTPNGRLYEIKFSDIPASDLGVAYTVKTDGLTILYSALSYAYLAQSSTDPTLVAVANALGAYYEAVNDYWSE